MKNYVTFTHPYVLVEDAKAKYQPVYKEYLKDIPSINLDSPTLCCPFSTLKRPSRPRKKAPVKSGYCEICYVKYADYDAHVSAQDHVEYAEDGRNYKKIDSFIAEMEDATYGYSLSIAKSPCDRLEAEFSQGQAVPLGMRCDSGSLIRLSRDSSDSETEAVSFDIILNTIEKRFSQEK